MIPAAKSMASMVSNMKKLMMIATAAAMAASLAGCTTPAQRMAECRDQGYSRDTCYQVEQNRQSTERAARIEAAQKQAYENANAAFAEDEAKTSRRHHHHDHGGY